MSPADTGLLHLDQRFADAENVDAPFDHFFKRGHRLADIRRGRQSRNVGLINQMTTAPQIKAEFERPVKPGLRIGRSEERVAIEIGQKQTEKNQEDSEETASKHRRYYNCSPEIGNCARMPQCKLLKRFCRGFK